MHRKNGERLFIKAWSDRRMGNGFPLPEGRVRWDSGKRGFPVRVVRTWQKLTRAAGAAPSLGLSNATLDGAQSSLGELKFSLPIAGDGTG